MAPRMSITGRRESCACLTGYPMLLKWHKPLLLAQQFSCLGKAAAKVHIGLSLQVQTNEHHAKSPEEAVIQQR